LRRTLSSHGADCDRLFLFILFYVRVIRLLLVAAAATAAGLGRQRLANLHDRLLQR
jgi:hypothetical protein